MAKFCEELTIDAKTEHRTNILSLIRQYLLFVDFGRKNTVPCPRTLGIKNRSLM